MRHREGDWWSEKDLQDAEDFPQQWGLTHAKSETSLIPYPDLNTNSNPLL